MNEPVTIMEVGMRDGLQFEPVVLSTSVKVEFIRGLIAAGVKQLEVGSFVSPRYVPTLADTVEVISKLKPFSSEVRYVALAPTQIYLQQAIGSGIGTVAVFVGASDRFNRHNLRMSTTDALNSARQVVQMAVASNIQVRGYVSVCWGGPQDQQVTPQDVCRVAEVLWRAGCYEISLGDTTAAATPDTVDLVINALRQIVDLEAIALHCHDVGNIALANIDAALAGGVRTFDSALAGLGGCLAAGAVTGNVASEQLIDHLHAKGYSTGIDVVAIRKLSSRMTKIIKGENCG